MRKVHDIEYLMFIKEIGRLLSEYDKCTEIDVKNDIYSDIKLLSEAIKK